MATLPVSMVLVPSRSVSSALRLANGPMSVRLLRLRSRSASAVKGSNAVMSLIWLLSMLR